MNQHPHIMGLTIILAFGIAASIGAVVTAVTMTRNAILGDTLSPIIWLMLGAATASATLLIVASALLIHAWKHAEEDAHE